MLRVVYTPDKTNQGDIQGWIASIVDVTEHRRTESQRDLLIAEVNHRVKNTLATVISIAHQSFKKQQAVDISIRSFDDRIRALAQTHTRLAEASWSGVALETIIEDEIAPYRTDDNLHIVGPDIRLNPKCALSLGMALHELATNAAKYGALSVKNGSIKITWEVIAAGKEGRLRWIEWGGPKVNLPQRSGFGRLLLEKALPSDLNGTVKLDFHESGLACLITFPLDGHGIVTAEKVTARADASTSQFDLAGTAGNSDRLAEASVLIVEDETLLALELDDVFNSVGSNVIGPFSNLSQATQAVRNRVIDVAILDTNLNGEMVYPLAEELGARGIPFLFLTGYDASNLPDRFRAVSRVAKPFSRGELLQQVQTAMIRNESRDLEDRRATAK
jgi:two-component sensor histidine kinase